MCVCASARLRVRACVRACATSRRETRTTSGWCIAVGNSAEYGQPREMGGGEREREKESELGYCADGQQRDKTATLSNSHSRGFEFKFSRGPLKFRASICAGGGLDWDGSRMTIVIARPQEEPGAGAEVTIDPAKGSCEACTGSRAALKTSAAAPGRAAAARDAAAAAPTCLGRLSNVNSGNGHWQSRGHSESE